MACCLFCAKPLTEVMLNYGQLDFLETYFKRICMKPWTHQCIDSPWPVMYWSQNNGYWAADLLAPCVARLSANNGLEMQDNRSLSSMKNYSNCPQQFHANKIFPKDGFSLEGLTFTQLHQGMCTLRPCLGSCSWSSAKLTASHLCHLRLVAMIRVKN